MRIREFQPEPNLRETLERAEMWISSHPDGAVMAQVCRDALTAAMNDALAWGYGFTITRLDPAEVLDLPKAPESEWRAVLTGLVDAMNRYGREVGDGDIPSAHRDLLWRAEQLLGSGSQLADANQKQINEAEHG